MQNNSLIGNIAKGIKKRFLSKQRNEGIYLKINWLRTKLLKHQNSKQIRKIKVGKLVFFFKNPFEFLITFQEIFQENIYDCQLNENPYIIDCGANIGISLLYFKERFPKSRVLCFEPDDMNFELLKRNVQVNKLTDVEIRKEAVWTEDTCLHFSNDANMASKVEMANRENTRLVDAVHLDKFIKHKIDFLKMDIEGAEFQVLKSITNKLDLIENMFIEYHGTYKQSEEFLELLKIVNDAGFSFYLKEATSVYDKPFLQKSSQNEYDIQINIFCFKQIK